MAGLLVTVAGCEVPARLLGAVLGGGVEVIVVDGRMEDIAARRGCVGPRVKRRPVAATGVRGWSRGGAVRRMGSTTHGACGVVAPGVVACARPGVILLLRYIAQATGCEPPARLLVACLQWVSSGV